MILRILGFAALVVAVAIGTGFAIRDLRPPGTLRFAAGIEGGGYWRFAERYRDILAEDGIALELIPTAGSVENAVLIDQGRAEAGLLQGGVTPAGDAETLGALFIEPVLIFGHVGSDRAAIPPNVGAWSGLTVAAGAEGSGTRAALRLLFRAAGIAGDANTVLPLGGQDAAAALMDGTADVAVFVAPLSAPYLEPLLQDESVALLPLRHAVTLSRRMPQATLVEVPSGAFRLSPPLPPVELELLALVARMVASPDLHPGLVDRLVEATVRVHGDGDVLAPEGTFPSIENTVLPLDSYARDRLADGPSPLAEFLPFWAVAQLERLTILLLPVVFLLLPLLRALPGLYSWGLRSRVYRHYARIREIEGEVEATQERGHLERLDGELMSLDHELATVRLPLAYRDLAYNARLHIELIRRRIEARAG